jgi:quercetin dioxygenase-like cupin family protein
VTTRASIRHRTHVHGTGALHEPLPYYRWGVAAGLLGAFVVAVFFLALDLAAGRPFATPNALGSALFEGVPFDPARPLVPIVILAYSLVHGALLVGVALVVCGLVLGSRTQPPSASVLGLVLAGSFFAGLTFLSACFSSLSAPLATGLRTPLVLASHVLAAISMAGLIAISSQKAWHPESPLVPRPGRGRGARERSRAAGLHGREDRESRLDPEWFHLFSLTQLARKLREEPEYVANGRAGLVLLRSESLRALLEVAAEGTRFAEHTVLGAAIVVVLEGALEIVCDDEKRVARAGEMAVIPHDRPRMMCAVERVTFVWVLPLDPPDEDADARSFAMYGEPRAFGPRGS